MSGGYTLRCGTVQDIASEEHSCCDCPSGSCTQDGENHSCSGGGDTSTWMRRSPAFFPFASVISVHTQTLPVWRSTKAVLVTEPFRISCNSYLMPTFFSFPRSW